MNSKERLGTVKQCCKPKFIPKFNILDFKDTLARAGILFVTKEEEEILFGKEEDRKKSIE